MFGRRKDARRRRKRRRQPGSDGTPDPGAEGSEDGSPFFAVVDESEQASDEDAPGASETAEEPDAPGPSDADDAPSEAPETAQVAESKGSGSDSGGIDMDAINAKVQKVVEGIQGLEHLSELVSLRYNPFLEVDENDVFDGKRLPPDELVQGFFSPTGETSADPAAEPALGDDPSLDEGQGSVPYADSPSILPDEDFPSFMEVARVSPRDRDGEEDLDESIDLTDLPIDEIHSAIGRPERPPSNPDGDPSGGPRPIRHGAPLSDRDRARRTLLVLSWFRRLQSHGPPACLFLFLDHCRRMEWVDESGYKWLIALAEGVTKRDEDLSWDDLELDPIELTTIHEANLLFLDDLFTDRLRLGERGYLTSHIGDYFEAA